MLETIQEFVETAKSENYNTFQILFGAEAPNIVKVSAYSSGRPCVVLKLNLDGRGRGVPSAFTIDEEREYLKRALDIAREIRQQGNEIKFYAATSVSPVDYQPGSIEEAEKILENYDNFVDVHSPEHANEEFQTGNIHMIESGKLLCFIIPEETPSEADESIGEEWV